MRNDRISVLMVTIKCSDLLIHLFIFCALLLLVFLKLINFVSETYDVATYDVEDKENAADVTVDLSPSQSTMLKKNGPVDLDVTAHGLGSKNSTVMICLICFIY